MPDTPAEAAAKAAVAGKEHLAANATPPTTERDRRGKPPVAPSGKGAADKIKGDVQKQADAEQAQGFVGTSPDPHDDSEYTLESGPDSPPAVPDERTATAQHHV